MDRDGTPIALGGRKPAMSFGLTELADADLESPVIDDGFAAALPTYSPAGTSLVPCRDDPPAFSLPLLPEAAPGEPVAPACPSGVAAKAPRRFPAGGFAGATTAGRRFSAMTRPRAPNDSPDPEEEDPGAETEGGGATTFGT